MCSDAMITGEVHLYIEQGLSESSASEEPDEHDSDQNGEEATGVGKVRVAIDDNNRATLDYENVGVNDNEDELERQYRG